MGDMDVRLRLRLNNKSMAHQTQTADGMELEQNHNNSTGYVVNKRFIRLRVLLIEPDDSTRQIIAALLRKCSYRVAAVSDGLKAWEVLKERSRNVDLILTEVELPSISGFALLTLIMEHPISKNIPVIMMSSQDSISTVYKCMMQGASDYLVKPLRRNELTNLWQHVWRRQPSANITNALQDESLAEKIEVTSENETATASNHSTGYVAAAGVRRNNKNIEKGSDAQSSCTKVDFEVGTIYHRESLQPRPGNSLLNDLMPQKDEPRTNLSQRLVMNENEAEGLAMGCYVNADQPITLSMGLEPNNVSLSPNIVNEACDNDDLLDNPTRNATAFDHARTKYPDYNQRSSPSTDATNKFDSALHLDLSLRRCYPNNFEGPGAEGRATLRQSSVSAFTRYTSRPLQTLQSKSSNIYDQEKECGSNSEQSLFGIIPTSRTSDTLNPMQSLQRCNSSLPLITSQSNDSETAQSCHSERVIPVPISLKDLRFENQCSGFGSLLSPNCCTQLCPSPSSSPTLITHPEPISAKKSFYPLNIENHNLEHFSKQHHIVNNATNQLIENLGQKLDSMENQGHTSPPTDHSANSSLCGGNATHLHSMGYSSTCGSNTNVDQVGIVKVASDSKNEETLFSQGGDPHPSSRREAALTKFRLKRKDRCFEKKVRYESRKKLAEQRPRVKGQFVRRV